MDRLDGNETIGLRLYKEVNTFEKNGKLPTISFHWETLATNLEEFQKVVVSSMSEVGKEIICKDDNSYPFT